MTDQPNYSNATPISQTSAQAPDFKQVRRYLRTDWQREMLEQFIKAGWTPGELAELARPWKLPSKTRPNPEAYRHVIGSGPDSPLARFAFKRMRAPGYVLPPFDRPDPIAHDDPDNREHSAETRADVEMLARRFMARADDSCKRPRRGPEAPISKKLWKSCFGYLKRYGGLGKATIACRLWRYI
jgi:hypothetical protein